MHSSGKGAQKRAQQAFFRHCRNIIHLINISFRMRGVLFFQFIAPIMGLTNVFFFLLCERIHLLNLLHDAFNCVNLFNGCYLLK